MQKIFISFDPFSYPSWPFSVKETDLYFTKDERAQHSLCYDEGRIHYNDETFGQIRFSFINHFKQFEGNRGARGPLYMAIKKERKSVLIDSTMGSGKDSCLMASWGFKLHSFERHPLLFILLWDSWQEARESKYGLLADNIQLHFGSCFEQAQLERWEHERLVIYYDPMYPAEESAKKSALPRQSIQFFRELVGSDNDIEKNLNFARTYAEKSILKRAIHSKWNFQKELVANVSYKGKNTRYDVFFR